PRAARPGRDLRPDRGVQPGAAAGRPEERQLHDLAPRPDGGIPRRRLRAPLRARARAPDALARRGPPPLPGRRCRGDRERSARLHRPPARREPRQAARQGGGAVRFEGTQVQNAIYLGRAEWPIAPAEWEARAEAALDPRAFGYIAGGAGAELTMRANREAFERVRLRPRMLAGNLERDLDVEVLGTRSAAPFLLAPIGVLSIAHPEGEVAAARAAAATGVPFVLSSAASHSIE